MPTFGSQPGAWSSYSFYGWNTSNQQAESFVVPGSGIVRVDSLSGYFSGDSGPLNAQLCVWNSGGTLLAATPAFAAAAGAKSTGGQAWHTASLSSQLQLSGGATVYLGWWRNPANGNNCIFSYAGGGSVLSTTANSSAAGNLGTTSAGPGALGIYASYTAGQEIYVNGTRVDMYINGSLAQVYVNGRLL